MSQKDENSNHRATAPASGAVVCYNFEDDEGYQRKINEVDSFVEKIKKFSWNQLLYDDRIFILSGKFKELELKEYRVFLMGEKL